MNIELYHSLPPIQELLGKMTRLESVALRPKATASNTTATTITTVRLNMSDTKDIIPTIEPSNNTTATTTTTSTIFANPTSKPTADRRQSKNRTGKDTTSETETNNKNNNDNPTKADDSHILGPSDYLLEQQKAAAEVERREKERMEGSESRRQLKRQRLECERRQVEMTQTTAQAQSVQYYIWRIEDQRKKRTYISFSS